MEPDRATSELWIALHELRDALRVLALTVEEDHPPARAVPEPVDRAVGDVADLLGDANEAIAAAAIAVGAGPVAAGDALRRCQRRLAVLGRRLDDGLGAPDRLDDLATVARERGGAWRAWRGGVIDGVGRVRHSLWEALSLLAERATHDTDRGDPAPCSSRRTDGVDQ
jgi:hypothetical protein